MDINTLIEQAEAHIEAGRHEEAKGLYSILLQAFPRDVGLLVLVARVYTLIGQPRSAKQLLLRAVTLDAVNVPALHALARHFLLMERNRVAAKQLLEQIVELDASAVMAWLDMGHIHAAEGEPNLARACYRRALDLDPRVATSLSPLMYVPPAPVALARLAQDLDALAIEPGARLELMLAFNAGDDHSRPASVAWAASGCPAELQAAFTEAALALGRDELAAASAEGLARTRPDDPEVLGLLGDVMLRQRRFEEARTAWHRLFALAPSRIDALINSWVAEIGCSADPASLLPQMLADIRAGHHGPAEAFTTLARAAMSLHHPVLAEALFKAALEEAPDDLGILNELAGLYYAEKRVEDAVDAYERILVQDTERPDVYANLLNLNHKSSDPRVVGWIDRLAALDDPKGAVLSAYNLAKKLCLWDEAGRMRGHLIDTFRTGKLAGPVLMGTCFNMLGDAAVDNATLFAMHLSVAEGFRRNMKRLPYVGHPALRRCQGKMRIGYVSGDFATHVVNGFFSGLINHCDRSRFEVYCYSTRPEDTEDHVSQQYRLAVDKFVNVAKEDDAALAQRIYDDGIHVLVDLAGYTAYSRISMFTYTPAPVQMTYLGYSYSTGLAEVDYIIADPFLDGPRTGFFCAEKPLRLPECFMNFGEVKPYQLAEDIPYDRNGYITFGTMNKSQKMNPEVIRLWSRVMTAVPGSRMVMKRFDYALERTRERIWQEFERNGIERERVRIIWQDETANYLDFYTTLDLALDPFPFTGATTTMETIRMGVPLVTLVGDAIAQRNSYAVMNNAGLDLAELYAFSEDEFVAKAISLANDPDRIRWLHRAMPEAVHKSSLVRPEAFARQMEAAFVEGWNRKFPQHPWGGHGQAQQDWVTLVEGTQVAVANSPTDLYYYVLHEQGRWFENEWPLLVGMASVLGQYWEVSADPGVYALPMARHGTASVRVWNTATTAVEMLRAGCDRNGVANLALTAITREVPVLPWEARPDALRLSTEAGVSALDFVRRNRDGLAEADPVLVLPVQRQDWAALAAVLGELGYAPFVFVPALNALVPFLAGLWDTFTRNLVFLKRNRLQWLGVQGVAVPQRVVLDPEPAATDSYWLDMLAAMSYAQGRLGAWQKMEIEEDNREHFLALNLYALSRHEAATLDLRLACLEGAAEHAVTALAVRQTPARLLTAARILADAGRRSRAVQCLNQLVGLFADTGEPDLDEPFLALDGTWESASPEDDEAGWLFAMALATGDKWRAYSTRFTGLASLPILDRVIGTGWLTQDVAVRADLIRRRFRIESATADEMVLA